ncbi:FAD-dependent oxidoreductase [Loktanella sp. S4079]|uniref:FAD-dependent oxidoreductase n=1 Tax=Loktanella sp. S4079 TaxID=579483 RepID=UPI0005FA24FF|nr:FAD-dependent oxidoreductase [Loktanella sp. S4079]KJZ18003.1 thiamine biosynthesis protein thio [Loktanella sp. S4079]
MITIAGAGLAGLASAYELAKRGVPVRIFEAADQIGSASAARYAGGMLAPWCEAESADEAVISLGKTAAQWWAQITKVTRRGTLVVAPPRDSNELRRFADRTVQHKQCDGSKIAVLEPSLAGRFSCGLHFDQEAHLNPRRALADLARAVQALGVEITLGRPAPARVDLNCTGIKAGLTELRPVRGEMAILRAPDLQLTRTIRLLHPRFPLYVVPHGDNHYMVGATMIESNATRPPTLRSLSELFAAAYTLHPGFAEAAVIETGAGLRPAFPDNLPRLTWEGGTLYFNGLYRHGFLLAPAYAAQAATQLISETAHAHLC